MPPILIGAVIAGAAIVGGAAIKAGAEGDARSEEQKQHDKTLDLAQKAIDQQKADRASAVSVASGLARKSYGEGAAIDRLLQTKEQQLRVSLDALTREASLLDQTDPVIKASGEELVKLIKGESSKALEPVTQERNRQRSALEQQLESKLGAGWRTSSAGIAAVTKFDEGTTIALNDAQQKAISTLGSVFGTAGSIRPRGLSAQANDIFRTAMSADTTVLNAESGIQSRETQAYLNALNANPVNYGLMVGVQGQYAANAGASIRRSGEIWGGMVTDLGKVGAAAAMGGGGGTSAPASYGNLPVPSGNPLPYESPTFGKL